MNSIKKIRVGIYTKCTIELVFMYVVHVFVEYKLKFTHQGWWFFVIVRFYFVNNELWQKRDVSIEILFNFDSSEFDSWDEMT